jgi:hypothetical protein
MKLSVVRGGYLTQQRLERWEAADRVEGLAVGELIDVGLVPAMEAVHQAGFDTLGDLGLKTHRAAPGTDHDPVTVLDLTRCRIAWKDLDPGGRVLLEQALRGMFPAAAGMNRAERESEIERQNATVPVCQRLQTGSAGSLSVVH